WSLIAKISKPVNYKVLYGKKDKNENTSGESKASVYKRIGATVLPKFHIIDATATGDCIKSKLETLTKTYKRHAVKLRTTGTGVKEDGDNGSDSEEYCDFYIGVDGPDENTTDEAKNIWDQILKEFPFFSELHRIFVARPNVTPIAVTTGVGPHGKKTLHLQPLDPEPQAEFTDSQVSQFRTLHDALNHAQTQGSAGAVKGDTMDLSQGSLEPENFFLQTPANKRGPKPSSFSQESLSKAKERIQKAPKKRTIEDTLFDIQKANIDALNSRAQQEMNLRTCEILLEEFKQGIWTAAEYCEQISLLSGNSDTCPSKKACQFSPDWDEDLDI
ncbi:hypothetical protein SCLCIDRAFT_1225355, partial [Scleroderma citrinum Foug A]